MKKAKKFISIVLAVGQYCFSGWADEWLSARQGIGC